MNIFEKISFGSKMARFPERDYQFERGLRNIEHIKKRRGR